ATGPFFFAGRVGGSGRDIFISLGKKLFLQPAQRIDSGRMRDTCLRALSKKVQVAYDASTPTTGRLSGNFSRRHLSRLTDAPSRRQALRRFSCRSAASQNTRNLQ